jgi:hypothetical protein
MVILTEKGSTTADDEHDSTAAALATAISMSTSMSMHGELDRLLPSPRQLLHTHQRPFGTNERGTCYHTIERSDDDDDDVLLFDNEDYDDYVIAQELPYDESLQRVILNEIYDILSNIYCKSNCLYCFTVYNPIYCIIFMILVVVITPAVVLHWLLIDFIPIRVSENDTERKFRSHGIYTATGCAVLSIVYTVVSIIIEQLNGEKNASSELSLQLLYLFVFSSVVIINLIALKAIADRLIITIRVYIIAVWAMDFTLYTLLLCNMNRILHMTIGLMMVTLSLSIGTLLVCTIIARNAVYFWNYYYISAVLTRQRQSNRKNYHDFRLALIIMLLSIGSLGLLLLLIIKHATNYFQYIHNVNLQQT